uniref:Trefoil factor 3 n=1 Tax=Sciurus vulgaris TaxID=55149 RepID=A0A8D2D0R2_SCIVU
MPRVSPRGTRGVPGSGLSQPICLLSLGKKAHPPGCGAAPSRSPGGPQRGRRLPNRSEPLAPSPEGSVLTGVFWAAASQCVVPPKDRVDCGYPQITERDCNNRGCCFDSSTPGVPWCFKPLSECFQRCPRLRNCVEGARLKPSHRERGNMQAWTRRTLKVILCPPSIWSPCHL